MSLGLGCSERSGMVLDKFSFERRFAAMDGFKFGYDEGILADILKRKSSGRVLDLGCGSGGLSLELAGRGFDITCVDISETAIDRIREEAERRGFDMNIICADLECYEIEGEYDVVLALGVLQFLGDKGEGFLRRVMDCTVEGGINVIDAFRNRWLPMGKLEEVYSDWEVLERDEYVWERDDFAKMIYLVCKRW